GVDVCHCFIHCLLTKTNTTGAGDLMNLRHCTFDQGSRLRQPSHDTSRSLCHGTDTTKGSDEKKLVPDGRLYVGRYACFDTSLKKNISQADNALSDAIVDLTKSDERLEASVTNMSGTDNVTDNSTQS